MKGVTSFIRNGQWLAMAGAVVAGTFLVVSIVNATTTISTNIVTDGSLNATSSLAVDGPATLGGTLNVTGITTLGNASTSVVSVSGRSFFTGLATLANASSTLLSNSGAAWIGGTAAVTGTTTVAQSIVMTDADGASCIQFFATSTATVGKLVFYATTTPSVATAVGFLAYQYGSCN